MSFADHRHGVEVEVGESFADGQPRFGEMTLDATAATIGNFMLGERGEETRRRPTFLVGLFGELVPHQFDGGQAQLGEQEFDAGSIDGVCRLHARPPSKTRAAFGW